MTKVALITGASKGIGAATALAFSQAQYEVVINYRDNHASANKIVDQIKQNGGAATAIAADVFTDAGLKKLFAQVEKQYSQIDVLVNNAGQPIETNFGQLTTTDITNSLTGNFSSAVMCSQTAIPLMKKGGSILFTGSIYGLNYGSNPNLILYSAGKAALINFAQSLAESYASDFRSNVVAPGYTKTPAWDGTTADDIARLLAQNLQAEWIQADEIANAFVFLAKSPHITGQTIVVDAGWQKIKTI